jgi:hypothetical protein
VRSRGLIVAIACLGLAAATLLIPSAPTTDPWGWIVWGREVAHLDLSTAIGGAPSWKPLPVLFTTPLSLLGGAAPSLWLLVARAGGLLGLLIAFRLGSRVESRAAGLVAVAGLALSAHWVREFLHGYAEPLAIALLLLAVERHWSGRPRQALLLAAGVSLARPEAFPVVLLYGVLAWRRRELSAWFLVAVAAAVPALWIVPDWLGSGDPFHASRVASSIEPSGVQPTLAALGRAVGITPAPLAFGAVAGFAIARRAHDRRVVELSALAAGWVVLLLGLMVAGYPALGRFFVLPASLACVLGAVGVVRCVRLVAAEQRRLAVAALVALAALPIVAIRVDRAEGEARDAVQRARVETALDDVISEVPVRRLRACGVPVLPKALVWMRGLVAWRLELPLGGVRSVHTTGAEYLAALSSSGDRSIPREVRIRTRRRHLVLLDPFGRTPVRITGLDLDPAGWAGTWRLLLPDREGCRSVTGAA